MHDSYLAAVQKKKKKNDSYLSHRVQYFHWRARQWLKLNTIRFRIIGLLLSKTMMYRAIHVNQLYIVRQNEKAEFCFPLMAYDFLIERQRQTSSRFVDW